MKVAQLGKQQGQTIHAPDDQVAHHTCIAIIGKWPGTEREQQLVVFNKVTFPCNPDSGNFIAVVGVVGGSQIMKLPRPDGTTATYRITYRNLSAQQTSGDLIGMIKTFETR